MPNPTYERIADSDADEDCADIPSQLPRVQPPLELAVRPPIYYGDGPFDPPSSQEDSDEERFLHKSEHAISDEFGDTEPGNGLRVGSGKVSVLCAQHFGTHQPPFHLASDCPEISHILSGVIGALVGLHWCVCCDESLSRQAVPSIKSA